MKRIGLSFVAAALAAFLGCGGEDPARAAGEQAFTVPDSWTCATKVFEGGATRTLGNNSYQVVPGTQALGALKMYHPTDAAFDAIATSKYSGIAYAWTSSTPVRFVIVSAGPGKTSIFDYRPGASSGVVYANDGVAQMAPETMQFCFDAPAPVCGL